MNKISTKVFLTLFILGGIMFLGALSTRAMVGNELFEFGSLDLKQNLDPAYERELYRLISYATLLVMGGYAAALIGAIGFTVTTTVSWKKHGWLIMCAVLFFIFVPVELWSLRLDWKMIGLNFWGNWPLDEFRKAHLRRLTALSGLPVIANLVYYTIIIIAVWRPFEHGSAKNEAE
ncbi:MAG TPA: hypothetical protein VK470_04235 [Bacteroidota bacterium]|nr:hypothetical protein [Bacteroidota bacterium]